MTVAQKENPDVIFPDWNASPNVVALSTTRINGFSSGNYEALNIAQHVGDDPVCVRKNRDLVKSLLHEGVDLQWLQQVHGNHVIELSSRRDSIEADGLYTTKAGIACCISTADCLPVLFTNRQGDSVAAAHAGWRGLAAGILEQTVATFSSPPDEITAWLGPAIGPCHFEVGAEVREEFLTRSSDELKGFTAACFQPNGAPGKYMADLYKLAGLRLKAIGLNNISGGGWCTFCDSNRFYSYRRQSQTGRMVSLIYLKP